MRDVCLAHGIPMTIEDTWGGDIVTAAIAHLAQSTPSDFVFSATDFNSYGTKTIAANAPLTLKSVKTSIRNTQLDETARDMDTVQARIDACFASDDYKEGRQAFMEKRKPVFKGK